MEEGWRSALQQFAEAMKSLYGNRLSRVLLYGSRARGDASEASDIDVLVVLTSGADFWVEFKRISPVASRISLENDVVISAIPVDTDEFRAGRTPLLTNVQREAVTAA